MVACGCPAAKLIRNYPCAEPSIMADRLCCAYAALCLCARAPSMTKSKPSMPGNSQRSIRRDGSVKLSCVA